MSAPAQTFTARDAAVLKIVNGAVECERCPDEQAVASFYVKLHNGTDDEMFVCRTCAHSFLDLVLNKWSVQP